MVTGLVPLGVLSDQARNVRRRIVAVYLGADREERVEFGYEKLPSAEQIDQSLSIVRHEKRPLPRGPLAEVVPLAVMIRQKRVERRAPASVGKPASHEAQRTVEQIAVTAGALDVALVILLATQHARHLRDAPVVVAVFERLRHGSDLQIAGHIAVAVVMTRAAERFQEIAERIAVGRRFHRLVQGLCIEIADSLAIGIGYHRHRMVPDHAHILDSRKRPNR